MDSKNATTCHNTEEKLSDEEFKKLIPHLDLNQLFLIELKSEGKWIVLHDARYTGGDLKDITCAVCSLNVPIRKFKEHVQLKSHFDALNKAEQFFHPLFTSDRDTASDKVEIKKEDKTRKANAIAAIIEAKSSRVSERMHQNKSSNRIMLSLEVLMNVEFQQSKHHKWKKMLTSRERFTEKSRFRCHICGRYCAGIITLHAHLCGNAHRLIQNKVFALRLPHNADVNKYSVLACEGVGRTLPKDKCANNAPKKLTVKVVKQPQEGLIGVEYVARIQQANGEYSYACCLCHTSIIQTEELMETHLIRQKHRQKYCETHYPDTTKQFEHMVKSAGVAHQAGMQFVFSKIADGIEKYHGYGKPHETTFDYFINEKRKVCEIVEGMPHACQDFGPSFSTVVTKNDLIAFKNSPFGHIPRHVTATNARFIKPLKGKFYLNMRKHVSRVIKANREAENRQVSVSSSSPGRKRSEPNTYDKRNHSKSTSVSRSISQQPHHSRKRGLSSVVDVTDVWRTYRHRIAISAGDLEQSYLEYRQCPEKHPSYEKEWTIFWKRRKNELQDEGIDYRSYDFQPEWNKHFRHRLEELFGGELQRLKIDARRELNIPLDVEEDCRFSHAEHSIEPNPKKTLSESRHVERSSSQSRRSNSLHKEAQIQRLPISVERERPNIIGLLRLMTALDDHLGSTGEKILLLLTKALSLEKIYSDSSEQLEQQILNANNCRLLKLAQEKLKSQLYADLVESRKINSFNRVIETAEILLNRADSMGWSSVEEASVAPLQNVQIENLIEVLQKKTTNDPSLMKKKSLPDTLADLINQKKNNTQSTDNFMLSNENENRSYGVNSAELLKNTDLTKQNTSFTSKPNFSNFDLNESNSGVWNRLGNQTSYVQRHSQNFVDTYTNPSASNAYGCNPHAYNRSNNNTFGGANLRGSKNAYGGQNFSSTFNNLGSGNPSGSKNVYGGGNTKGSNTAYGPNSYGPNGNGFNALVNGNYRVGNDGLIRGNDKGTNNAYGAGNFGLSFNALGNSNYRGSNDAFGRGNGRGSNNANGDGGANASDKYNTLGY